jgi:hypothetical protein
MEARITVEQYFVYEVAATFSVVVGWVKGENRSISQWRSQVDKLKKAFHYFMLELEVDEFKDLRLPSENRPTDDDSKAKPKAKRRGGRVLPKVKAVGKQLQLFFIKTMKSSLLSCILLIERFSQWCTDKLIGEVKDYENRKRSQ